MKFVADSMLGKLAKWLRVLGYDVLYSASMEDSELARIARMEDRILLTRDNQLTRRKGLKSVLVKSDHLDQQMAQLVEALSLSVHADIFSRCLVCNTPLVDVETESVVGRVPHHVLATQTRFRRCPTCTRIYWRGTHWQRMKEKIKTMS